MARKKLNKKDKHGLPIGEQSSDAPRKHNYRQVQFVTSRTIAAQLQPLTTMTEDEAYSTVITVCKLIRNAVIEGKVVNMRHLGTFKRRLKSPHPGFNFGTGERTVIPEHFSCKFTPSAEFLRQMESGDAEPLYQISMNLIEGEDLYAL